MKYSKSTDTTTLTQTPQLLFEYHTIYLTTSLIIIVVSTSNISTSEYE